MMTTTEAVDKKVALAVDPLARLRMCIDEMERQVARHSLMCVLMLDYYSREHPEGIGPHMTMLKYTLRQTGRERVLFVPPSYGPNVKYATVREAGAAMLEAVSTFEGGLRTLHQLYVETRVVHHECWGDLEEDIARDHSALFGDEFRRELMEVAWAPHRHVDWCLDVDERRALGPAP